MCFKKKGIVFLISVIVHTFFCQIKATENWDGLSKEKYDKQSFQAYKD